jgi:CMP-N-acetylneuraminic acid synthetase
MSVSATYNWYFDDQHNLLNKDAKALGGNTKMLKPLYKASAAFLVANRERILKEHTYWSLTKDDPSLYVIDEREAFDIDTELDFQIAGVLYTLSRK